MAMEKTTLYLPTQLQQALREAARRSGRPQADLVRDALTRYLGDLPQPGLLSLGLGSDPDLTARDSEKWLRRRWDER